MEQKKSRTEATNATCGRSAASIELERPLPDRSAFRQPQTPRCGARERDGETCRAPAMRSRKKRSIHALPITRRAFDGAKGAARAGALSNDALEARYAAVQQRKQAAAERNRSREEDAILCTPWSSLKETARVRIEREAGLPPCVRSLFIGSFVKLFVR